MRLLGSFAVLPMSVSFLALSSGRKKNPGEARLLVAEVSILAYLDLQRYKKRVPWRSARPRGSCLLFSAKPEIWPYITRR